MRQLLDRWGTRFARQRGPRGITEDKVVKGAKIVGAAKVVEEIIDGAKAVAFA